MKVLVTGGSGQLGHDVSIVLGDGGHDVLAPSHSEMDVCDRESVMSYICSGKPDAVVHCAAWTAVDLAEDEPDRCRKVNAEGTSNIVEACRSLDIPMMYISTDYVFNGTGTEPWKTDDPTDPVNVYGSSKRDGELFVRTLPKHYIIRISWVFGINGRNFVKTMMNLSEKMESLNVVDDQIGSPTYTWDLAHLISDMVFSERYGTYHAHNEGECSWYQFAKEIFRRIGSDIIVNPVTSEEYPAKAPRPRNSRLDTSSLTDNGFALLPDWKDAIGRYIQILRSERFR